MTPEQRARRKLVTARYAKTDKGRAVFLRKAYQRTDACDLTVREVHDLIVQPCTYCGTTTEPRGLDRIDNSKSHVRGNVLPACVHCNFARADRLTVEEMKRVGRAIAEVLRDRQTSSVRSAAHL